jgi:glutamate---cysteine ligase / carboxylate-amine ligase
LPADEPQDTGLDLNRVRGVFEESQDFTIGLEEEFAIVNPDSLELEHRFEELFEACGRDEVLAKSAAGELIDTEIEIRSGRAETFAEAMALQQQSRDRLFALADSMGLALAAAGTHPWANYLDQRIIDTPHYRRLQGDLGWVAQRNNTWSSHVHVGVNGPDRAIAVCDWMRELLPPLLALSANSPFLDRRDTGLHSVRTEIFTRTFPRCGIPEPFVSWAQYADFVDLLASTESIVESTQLWWSIRPHHRFGTVEVRICDAQALGGESFALAGLMIACVAQTAMEYDRHGYSGVGEPLRDREIEENLWRAIRFGMDGELIDFRGRRLVPARQVVEELIGWTEPARAALGIEFELPEANGAQRQRKLLADGASIEEIYRASIEETHRTYAPQKAAVVKDSRTDG